MLVHEGTVLAEGWHKKAGSPHAEVECLNTFGAGKIPEQAVLYVNLEPCAHHGRTPPCTDLLIERKVKQVVVGQRDPFPLVAGRGMELLREAGVGVTSGILQEECRWAQRRFLTSVELGRPYVVLKWARSADGSLDRHPRRDRAVQRISSPATDVLVHRWRAEEEAILAGGRTVLNDDPALTVRHVEGRQPLRVVLDRSGITPAESRVYSGAGSCLLFTSTMRASLPVEQVLVPAEDDPIDTVLGEVHRRGIRSILVEGGAELLGHFIRRGIWDEARVITGQALFGSGTPSPVLPGEAVLTRTIAGDRIDLFINRQFARPSWEW